MKLKELNWNSKPICFSHRANAFKSVNILLYAKEICSVFGWF